MIFEGLIIDVQVFNFPDKPFLEPLSCVKVKLLVNGFIKNLNLGVMKRNSIPDLNGVQKFQVEAKHGYYKAELVDEYSDNHLFEAALESAKRSRK